MLPRPGVGGCLVRLRRTNIVDLEGRDKGADRHSRVIRVGRKGVRQCSPRVGPFGDAEGKKMPRVTHAILVATLLTVPVLVERAYAHHGAGLYDMRKNVELEGKITRVDFVNPHTYVYFDVVGSDGKVLAMKCETRGATVLRRS